jgi:hypothetical protein
MRFRFIIKKWANIYFFIQNLSEWHFSNRKSYNTLWKKELGPFGKKEEQALKELKKIHLKYGFHQELPYLGSFFILSKNPWKALKSQLAKQEITILKQIFLTFQAKFRVLWQKDFPLLKQWQEKLTKKANNKKLVHAIDRQLSIFYKTHSPKKVRVYLFLAPQGIGGTANPGGSNITLEISHFPLTKVNIALGMIWHETIHAHYEKYFFLPLLNKKFPQAKNRELKNLIQEATAQALFPFGILGRKILKTKEPKNSAKYVKPLSRLIQRYLKSKHSIDLNYIKEARAILSGSDDAILGHEKEVPL